MHTAWVYPGSGQTFTARRYASADTTSRKRKCADTTGTVLVPCAGRFQCQNINIFFSSKICENNLVKQHSETVTV